jgi:hypothetical protein
LLRLGQESLREIETLLDFGQSRPQLVNLVRQQVVRFALAPDAAQPIAERRADRAEDLHRREQHRNQADRFAWTHGPRPLSLEPVGLTTLRHDPLGEVDSLLQLGYSMMQDVHFAQPLLQLLDLGSEGGIRGAFAFQASGQGPHDRPQDDGCGDQTKKDDHHDRRRSAVAGPNQVGVEGWRSRGLPLDHVWIPPFAT